MHRRLAPPPTARPPRAAGHAAPSPPPSLVPQTVVEENEFQQGVTDARGMRALRGTTLQQTDVAGQLQQAQAQARANLRTAALLYVRCLQQLMQDQCAVLIRGFGVNPHVSGVARRLWLALLRHVGILEPQLDR